MVARYQSLLDKISSVWLRVASRNRRVFAVDILSLFFAVYLGYALRLTFFVGARYLGEMLFTGAVFSLTVGLVLCIGKIYMIVWPLASVEEYARLLRYYSFGSLLFLLLVFFTNIFSIPRSSLAIFLISGILLISLSRASWRLIMVSKSKDNSTKKNTLIIGSGEAGVLLARDLLRHDSKLLPIGFIDKDPKRKGMFTAGLEVLGEDTDLPRVICDKKIDTVLIAIPSATGAQIRKYIDILAPFKVVVRVLPSLSEIADGQVNVTRLRSISLEDLLRRESVLLDDFGIASLVKGRTVMVTGAGGSIGAELCRQILKNEPSCILALGHGEMSLYLLIEALSSINTKIPVKPIVADVADFDTMNKIFKDLKPEIIFHAAAHKHVPLMEENPRESLRVNALGTWNVANLAGKYNALRVVMISTDKAVNPTSIMGATKRMAERLIFAAQNVYPKTLYMAVRFGNVLGSRGSVVPKFEKQIEDGGPVTVTHKDMKRYFMLIPEAVSLVLQAGTMGYGGELFVLDMGEPVNITEMAETLIRLHGHEPYKEIAIKFTGIRPGEKLYEELFYDPLHVDTTAHEKIFLSRFNKEKDSILPSVLCLLEKSALSEISEDELKEGIFALAQDTPQ